VDHSQQNHGRDLACCLRCQEFLASGDQQGEHLARSSQHCDMFSYYVLSARKCLKSGHNDRKTLACPFFTYVRLCTWATGVVAADQRQGCAAQPSTRLVSPSRRNSGKSNLVPVRTGDVSHAGFIAKTPAPESVWLNCRDRPYSGHISRFAQALDDFASDGTS
jgi:hypothetical protein